MMYNSSIVFDRRVDGRTLSFGTTGKTERIVWKLMVSGERYDPTRRAPRFIPIWRLMAFVPRPPLNPSA